MSQNQWTHLYKKGFAQISSFVEQVEEFAPETADIMIESLNETNRRLLQEVRAEKEELEEELKRFLARVNGKLSYLKSMENHLAEWENHFDTLKEGAANVTEGGKRHEKETRTDSGRQSS
ncbi:hypothetical protein [Paenibacillus sanguinis]|uniref:hypothetical protein n=1 Tax=Paenibacillus sanguinis TaxID=225906 RepID=UPI000367925E|nr:hypothetical protein [Paenibacillus sanguinis]